MPINFITMEQYKINYSNLYNEINKSKILNDRNIQARYLMAWMKRLQDAEDLIFKELKSEFSFKRWNAYVENYPEIFQLPIQYNSNRIIIHFSVSRINNMVCKDIENKQFIDITEFTGNKRLINWDVRTTVTGDINEFPIIIIPFIDGSYTHRVIDGNHRISNKVKNNEKGIYAFCLNEQSIIDNSFFISVFDKYFYIMSNELNRMAIETKTKNLDAKLLIKNSYLLDQKIHLQ